MIELTSESETNRSRSCSSWVGGGMLGFVVEPPAGGARVRTEQQSNRNSTAEFNKRSSSFQDPEKEVSDWLSDLTLTDQHPDLEVRTVFLSA